MATTAVTSAATPAARADRPARQASWAYYLLFFISGFPALLYQIIWQRSLFTLFGANVESVTIIVTVFMLGLGWAACSGADSLPGPACAS
jgi:spermidine synthase